MEVEEALCEFRQGMEDAGIPQPAIGSFERMYRAYRRGESGFIPWTQVSPLEPRDLVRLEDLGNEVAEEGISARSKVAWIVLNGGLGTSMRMSSAKSLVPVRGESTFLDLLAQHVLALRARWGVEFPFLLMNSFATRKDTLASRAATLLVSRDEPCEVLPLDFVQHQFPRIRESDGLPARDLRGRISWAPSGHGDVYLALETSGALDALIRRGVRWAFVSNADNLGATLHPSILGLMISGRFEFLMEVTSKTLADVKGGTLIRRGGRLALLELAQVSPEHQSDFQSVESFPVFNTNSLWIDLAAVRRRVEENSLELPLIVNRKSLDGIPVVQLETAMGAAVQAFAPAAGVLVPRTRFAPVKTTDDLLIRRSDVYVQVSGSPLGPNPERDPSLSPPIVRLDPRFYSSVAELDLRIPSPLGLLRTVSLEVIGDVRFGRDVTVEGRVRVENTTSHPMRIPDGTVLRSG